jgi:predicted AAA+ superfamily ATPase
VVSKVLKWRLNRRQNKDIYFWRDSNDQEIDLLIEKYGGLLAIECKAGQTIAADWFGGIEKFLDVTGSNQAWLIYGGDQTQQRKRVSVLGWQGLAAAMELRSGSPGENVRTRVSS